MSLSSPAFQWWRPLPRFPPDRPLCSFCSRRIWCACRGSASCLVATTCSSSLSRVKAARTWGSLRRLLVLLLLPHFLPSVTCWGKHRRLLPTAFPVGQCLLRKRVVCLPVDLRSNKGRNRIVWGIRHQNGSLCVQQQPKNSVFLSATCPFPPPPVATINLCPFPASPHRHHSGPLHCHTKALFCTLSGKAEAAPLGTLFKLYFDAITVTAHQELAPVSQGLRHTTMRGHNAAKSFLCPSYSFGLTGLGCVSTILPDAGLPRPLLLPSIGRAAFLGAASECARCTDLHLVYLTQCTYLGDPNCFINPCPPSVSS